MNTYGLINNTTPLHRRNTVALSIEVPARDWKYMIDQKGYEPSELATRLMERELIAYPRHRFGQVMHSIRGDNEYEKMIVWVSLFLPGFTSNDFSMWGDELTEEVRSMFS